MSRNWRKAAYALDVSAGSCSHGSGSCSATAVLGGDALVTGEIERAGEVRARLAARAHGERVRAVDHGAADQAAAREDDVVRNVAHHSRLGSGTRRRRAPR